ncbi:MAG: Uma2 family endonuclease, partial [Pseudanabaena sp.]
PVILRTFSSKGKAMINTLAKAESQYLVKWAVTWEQFKTLQSAFDEIGGVRLSYCEGELEIMGIGLHHEMISSLLGILLSYYFVTKRIRFTSTGAYTQKIEPNLEFQADLSFAFGNDPANTDLCIEIVVTSGGVKKLRKYQLRGIPEVWFWVDGKISIYRFVNGEYIQSDRSEWLPELDIEHLEECLLIESQLDSILAFQQKYQVN